MGLKRQGLEASAEVKNEWSIHPYAFMVSKGKNLKNLLLFPRLCICLVDSVLLVLFKTFYCVYLHRVSSKENELLFFFYGSCFAAFQVTQSDSHHILRIRIKPISSSYF
jgi:hypothetical protein